MKNPIKLNHLIAIAVIAVAVNACKKDDDDDTDPVANATIPTAYSEFDADNTTIYASGDNIVIESNGYPNHTSPYWSNTTARSANNGGMVLTTPAASSNHPLFVEPTSTSYAQMAPGNIDDFNGSYTLTVPANPSKATTTSSTGLGAIGIAVSGL